MNQSDMPQQAGYHQLTLADGGRYTVVLPAGFTTTWPSAVRATMPRSARVATNLATVDRGSPDRRPSSRTPMAWSAATTIWRRRKARSMEELGVVDEGESAVIRSTPL